MSIPNTLKHSINAQRTLLSDLLGSALQQIAAEIAPFMGSQQQLDRHLRKAFASLDYCKYIYVLDQNGVQISSTINRYGTDEEAIGRDRSSRPYMQHVSRNIDFNLSEAYISRNKKRPSVTAIQVIRDDSNQVVGYLGVDFDLRELPHSKVIYEEPSQWRQIKGDPAIRDGLFLQQRVENQMDKHIDNVMSVHQALILDQGVHHIHLHFSSSRSTIWHVDDPFVYRILTMDELANTDICLAYPQRPYFKRAIVPASEIGKILQQFRDLRFADETIYLRSASLNIVNGKIGLNFSCDGSHYLNYDEFLQQGLDFWLGSNSDNEEAIATPPLDIEQLDTVIEDIAGEGCIRVNKLLYAMENNEVPEKLAAYNEAEREYIYQELKSVMDAYDGGVCKL